MNKALILLRIAALLPALVMLMTSCHRDDDDTQPQNEQELITTVILTFVDLDNTSSVFAWRDTDGPGGADPEIDEISLDPETTYNLFVAFLDESDPMDIKDITEEVEEESDEHLICFSGSNFNAEPTATNKDSNGDPLGTEASLETGPAGDGTLTIRLKHDPDKTAATPCNTGETDVEVTFPVKFE